MNIAEVEKLTGMSKQTIRFYEKEGLVSPKRNQENQYREYDENDIKQLKLIYVLRKTGLSVEDISRVLKDEISMRDAINARRAEIVKERKERDKLLDFCDSLKMQSKEWIDVDKYVSIIQQEEKQGNKFAELLEEYKQVYRGEWKKQFSFIPDQMITTSREFTEELLKYAKLHNEDITITKESMYPEFILNGVEYSATRLHGRFGATVHCEMLHPELEEPENVTGTKKKVLQLIAKYIPFVALFLLEVFLFVTGHISLGASIVLAVILTIVSFAFWYPYRGNKDY